MDYKRINVHCTLFIFRFFVVVVVCHDFIYIITLYSKIETFCYLTGTKLHHVTVHTYSIESLIMQVQRAVSVFLSECDPPGLHAKRRNAQISTVPLTPRTDHREDRELCVFISKMWCSKCQFSKVIIFNIYFLRKWILLFFKY